MKRLILLLLAFLVVGGLSLTMGLRALKAWSKVPREVPREVIVHFPKGTHLQDLADVLAREGAVTSAARFRWWVRLSGQYARFQAGNYRFGPGSVTPAKIANAMVTGDAYVPVVLQVTIPEGFNIRQIAARLAAHGLGSPRSILQLMQDREFLTSLKVNAGSLEGYLYPATYNYTTMPQAKTVLTDMVTTFWNRLPASYLDDLKAVGLTLHQAVTFASLIELETTHDDEKVKIAEVIWRRLKAKDNIAIDAALIYGIKDYQGDIKWTHLRDATNPYNTRIHKGLPPGPIGSPASSSLDAVLKPTTNGYYFYVLDPEGLDRHHFSTSLSEHNRYVKLLLEADKSKSAARKP